MSSNSALAVSVTVGGEVGPKHIFRIFGVPDYDLHNGQALQWGMMLGVSSHES